MAVFAVTLTSGALLAGAATADDQPSRDRSPAVTAAAPPRPSLIDSDPHRFAYSLAYSGAAAMAVSVAGLVMVGRRRRCW